METGSEKSIEVEVSVKVLDTQTNTFTEVIGTTAKLTKADAGITGGNTEEWITISIDPGHAPNYSDAKVLVSTHSKVLSIAPSSN